MTSLLWFEDQRGIERRQESAAWEESGKRGDRRDGDSSLKTSWLSVRAGQVRSRRFNLQVRIQPKPTNFQLWQLINAY